MATDSNGIAGVFQLQKQLGLGSDKIGLALVRSSCAGPWSLPAARRFTGLVEIDETAIPQSLQRSIRLQRRARTQRRGQDARRRRRWRCTTADPAACAWSPIADFSATSLHAFVKANVEAGATAKTDGWFGLQLALPA